VIDPWRKTGVACARVRAMAGRPGSAMILRSSLEEGRYRKVTGEIRSTARRVRASGRVAAHLHRAASVLAVA